MSTTTGTGEKTHQVIELECTEEIVEENARQINGHDLVKARGEQGPLTEADRERGVLPYYRFWICKECGESSMSTSIFSDIECREGKK